MALVARTTGDKHKIPTRKKKTGSVSSTKSVGIVTDNFTGDRPAIKPLSLVKPNTWNPNRMTPFERESLKVGLKDDGWLMSQALLIWGSDDKGVEKNIIIDGEQCWTVAPEAGFTHGPMVFLRGLSEAKAKALTVKIDAKRGKFADEPLGALLREVERDLGPENLALSLGIEDDRLALLLSTDPKTSIPPNIDDQGVPYKQQFGVLVVCESESEHRDAYKKLDSMGFKLRVLTV